MKVPPRLLQEVARSLGSAFAGLHHPTVLAALALGLAPALVLAALPLFRWAERLAEGSPGTYKGPGRDRPLRRTC